MACPLSQLLLRSPHACALTVCTGVDSQPRHETSLLVTSTIALSAFNRTIVVFEPVLERWAFCLMLAQVPNVVDTSELTQPASPHAGAGGTAGAGAPSSHSPGGLDTALGTVRSAVLTSADRLNLVLARSVVNAARTTLAAWTLAEEALAGDAAAGGAGRDRSASAGRVASRRSLALKPLAARMAKRQVDADGVMTHSVAAQCVPTHACAHPRCHPRSLSHTATRARFGYGLQACVRQPYGR